MRSRRLWPMPALIVSLVVSLAATSFVATPSAGAAHGTSKDEKIATAGLLVAGDFTTDWTEQTGTGGSAKKFATAVKDAGGVCKRFAATAALATTKPSAASGVFTNASAEASNRVAVLTTPKQAQRALSAFRQSTTRACLTKVLPQTLPAVFAMDPDLGKIKSMKMTVTPGDTAPIADANGSWEAKVTAKLANGKSKTIYVNEEAVAEGRSFDTFEFVSADKPLDGIHDHLIASSVGRLQGALKTTALGESTLLASTLTPAPGYTYEEAPEEAQISMAADLSDPAFAQYAQGESLHSIVTTDGTSVGFLLMIDYRPSYASLPGFKDSEATGWAQALVEDSGGTMAPATISGHPVTIVTYPDGTTSTLFWIKNVLVFANSGSEPAATSAFVTEYLARTPA